MTGNKEKVLLVLCPFWTPLIPPLGISCLKRFIRDHGYDVKTVDINIEREFSDIKNNYFAVLEELVPVNRRGNFYNVGNDVLGNHMMAYLNSTGGEGYLELVKCLVDRTFFCRIDSHQVMALHKPVGDFFTAFENCLVQLLEKEKPSVFGVSVFRGTLPASLFAFKLAKARFPGIRTVMGGGIFADQLNSDSPDFAGFLEKTPYIDNIIIGEGEILLLKLLRGELPGNKKIYAMQDIEGETLDLSRLGMLDFSDLNVRFYPNLASFASRSCPFQCGFCSETVQWGKYRKRAVQQITAETAHLYKTYNTQLFLMGDSLLNPVATDLANEFLKGDTAIYWDGYLRADKDVCDPETTLAWRRGGFYRARLGLESGSRKVLESMGKKVSIDQIKAALYSLANAGIKTTTYWVIGYPGETEEDFLHTLDLIEELKNEIYEAECNPFNYFPTGQVNSQVWAAEKKRLSLYPEEANDLLIVPTWILDSEPSRKETYHRMRRFVEHCRSLGVPNPYSMEEINAADERWKKLHKSAVPPLVHFIASDTYINECRHAKKLLFAKIKKTEDKSFVI